MCVGGPVSSSIRSDCVLPGVHNLPLGHAIRAPLGDRQVPGHHHHFTADWVAAVCGQLCSSWRHIVRDVLQFHSRPLYSSIGRFERVHLFQADGRGVKCRLEDTVFQPRFSKIKGGEEVQHGPADLEDYISCLWIGVSGCTVCDIFCLVL